MISRLAGIFVLTAAGAFAFQVTVGGCTITTGAVLPQAVKGAAITYTITTNGCALPFRFFEKPTGTLPPGMVLNSSGSGATIRGASAAAGVYAFAVRAVDGNYAIPSKSFVIEVNDVLRIDTLAAATGATGAAYTDTIRARGGVAPYTFSIVEGALPAGLTLGAGTGVISGTMPAAGTQFRVRVTDSSSPANTVERPFTIVPGGQVTTLTAPPVGSVGAAYSFDVDGSLGSSGFAQVLGALPGGLTMDGNGLISGTPAAAGESHFTVRQTAGSVSVWRSYRILVNSAATITGTPRDAEEGFAYDHVFTVSGAVAPYIFFTSGGGPPTGITLDARTGALLGELPAGVAGNSFTLSVADASGRTYTQAFSITRAFRLQGGAATPSPMARVNQSVSGAAMYSLSAGGSGKTFERIGGVGGGLIFVDSVAGTVSFQIPTPGVFTPVVMGRDSLGGAVLLNEASITVVGDLGISSLTELPNARASVAYSNAVTVVNGNFTPLSFAVPAGNLPTGLSLNASTGFITGTPAAGAAGLTFPFTVSVSDAAGQLAYRDFFIGVGASLGITTTSVAGGTTGSVYNVPLNQTGAPSPLWSNPGGGLPLGITFSALGVLSGTPVLPGRYPFLVRISSSASSESDTKQFTIHVANPLTASILPASLLQAYVGSSASAGVTPTGGLGPVTLSFTGGSLPEGMYLQNLSPLRIAGVPVAAGTSNFSISVVDADSRAVTIPYSIIVRSPPRITSGGLTTATRTVAYNHVLTGEGGLTPYSWSLVSGALPPGIGVSAGGVLSGTPTTNGTFTFVLLMSDANGVGSEKTFTIEVTDPVVITNSVPMPAGLILTAYSTPVTTTGGATSKTFSISAGDLPPLVAINSATGLISNLPLVAGTYNFTVRAVDIAGRVGALAEQITIGGGLTISPATVPNGVLSTPYSVTFSATGAVGSVLWSVSAGALPAGLTLNAGSGLLSGTPTGAGSFSFTVQALDSTLLPVTASYTMTVLNVLSIVPTTVANGTVGVVYSQTLTASGATGTVSWAVTTGALPAGLSLGVASGVIGGTPTAAGSFAFTVTATDSLTQTGTRAYSMTVLNVLSIAPVTAASGTVGVAYSQALTASGATGAVSWAVTAGALPAGLSLGAASGIIGGTPTAAGSFAFTVVATDSLTQTGTRAYSMTVLDPLAITTASLPDGTEQESYTATLASSSGAPSGVTWSITADVLPPGLTLAAATGVISGTTTLHGTYPITVRAANTQGQAATRALSILVVELLTITTQTLGEAVQGQAYTGTMMAAGGPVPYVWSLVGTALPAGLALNAATGQILGTTSSPEGGFAQNVSVTDARGRVARRTLGLAVSLPPPPSLSIGPLTVPNGRVGQSYSASFSATGGTPGYTITVAQGAAPTGLSMTSGTLAGTPTQEGTFRFTVNATDAEGRVAGNSYVVVIEPALVPLVVTPATIATTAPVGQALTLQFGATGGKGPHTFSFSGNLPVGMSSNSSGLLSGTPSQGGSFAFSVEATDSLQAKASRSYTLTVTGNLTITTQAPLAEGMVGKAYSVTFGAAGGRAAFAWSVSGSAPAGLAFDTASGTLAGTAAAAGTYPFSVTVQDAQRLTATASFSITIYDPLEITNGPADVALVPGQAFGFAFATRGGKAPVSFVLSGGALPAGLAMSGAGAISGTPTTVGTYAFTAQATDALGNTAARAATLRVVATLTVATSELSAGTVGVLYSAGVAATGGVAPLGAWSVSVGTFPAGLALAGDGTISGTPLAPGVSSVTVRITDAAGTAATQALSIVIGLPPLPPVVISGLPQTLPPGTQTNVTIHLAAPFPGTVTGTLTLVFEPNAVNNADDPAVQFSSGGRTVTFTIPAGQTAGVFPVTPLRILSGTVAGTIRIRTATAPESSTAVPESTVPIARSLPVITAGTVQIGTGTFTVQIDGYSNTREISAATFRLTAAAGAPLGTTDVPVAVGAAFTTWYQSAGAGPFGGQFRLALPFTVTGSLTDIESVTVTVTNAVGTSQPVIVRLR